MKNKEKGLTLSLLFFRKRSFLNDFSTEEVSSPLSLSPAFKKVEKRKTAKGKRMCGWKGEVVEVLEDAAWRRGVIRAEEFPPTHATSVTATAFLLLLLAPQFLFHIHTSTVHTHTHTRMCIHLLPSVSHPQTHNVRLTARTTYFIYFYSFLLIYSSSFFLAPFFTNCLISPVLPV